jgi:hypothetical protein
MIRFAVTIICATMFTGMCVAQSNQPTLRRTGLADPLITGNLAGFQPIHKVWPDVRTHLPNGTQVTVTALVAHGKPIQISVRKSSTDRRAIEALAGALKKWRFAMPVDGTSPVNFAVTWEALDGKFTVQNVAIDIVTAR